MKLYFANRDDSPLYAGYEEIEEQIETLCAGHDDLEANPLNEDEYHEVRRLLREKANALHDILSVRLEKVLPDEIKTENISK